jgi:hypothetical protein
MTPVSFLRKFSGKKNSPYHCQISCPNIYINATAVGETRLSKNNLTQNECLTQDSCPYVFSPPIDYLVNIMSENVKIKAKFLDKRSLRDLIIVKRGRRMNLT